jgi:hypothetical protein
LARKRRTDTGGGDKPWLNTFADLMNLLLCFFVMLFAMSDMDESKFQNIAISMSNSFGIFEGTDELGDGPLITSGMTQLNNLDDYISNTVNGTETETEDESDSPAEESVSKIDEAYEVIKEKCRKYPARCTKPSKIWSKRMISAIMWNLA